MFEGQRIAVWDLEIKKPIEHCSRGWQSHDEMGISVLCLYDYATGRYRVFDDRTAKEAIAILWDYDVVCGFNTVGFDCKVVHASWDEAKSLRSSLDFDILREIWLSLGLNPDKFVPQTHGGCKLDDVAFETLGLRKSGDGALAPKLYQAGRWSELVDYCLEDVRIERALFEFVAHYGFVVRHGKRIPVAFKR
jgi:hypothetical protein